MKRLSIKILQGFAKLYFSYRCPTVRWKKMEPAGLAVYNKNIIYLNPTIPLDDSGCKTGTTYYRSHKKIKLKEGEQYFLILLHEIRHFTIRKRKPKKEWIKLKRELLKEARASLKGVKIGREVFGKKPMTKKEEQEWIWDNVWNNSEPTRGKGEKMDHYLARSENFRSWLIGDRMDEHASVEDWARKEFIKQRKRIEDSYLNRK